MGIWEDIRKDWSNIKKWFTEIRNFLLVVMVFSALFVSVIWLLSVQVVSITVVAGIVAVVSLIASIIGNYTYTWYIQMQLKKKNTTVEEITEKLRKVEDENLLLKFENTQLKEGTNKHHSETVEKETDKGLKELIEVIKNINQPVETEEKVNDTENRNETKNTKRSD